MTLTTKLVVIAPICAFAAFAGGGFCVSWLLSTAIPPVERITFRATMLLGLLVGSAALLGAVATAYLWAKLFSEAATGGGQ